VKANRSRWLILGLVVLAQLMVVLDATIVNIALPSAQQALQFSNGSRQWIVTAYSLAFGSLLPLGGRLGDLFGRKRMLVIGATGFALVSAAGGAAQSFEWLLAARTLQGVFGALLAPSALGLLTTTFPSGNERNKAFGIFGAVVGSGAAFGLLLGGALTEYLSWRWCLYVNLVIAVPVVLGALALLPSESPRHGRADLDLPGVVTSTGGLFLIVFGFDRAEATGWASGQTLGSLAVGIVLLALFFAIERRASSPLVPLRLLEDRNRAGSYLAVFFSGSGIFGVFLFVTYYLQGTLGYGPMMSGLAFLPMIVSVIVTSVGVNAALLEKLGPRPLIISGMLVSALGLVLLTRLQLGSSYAAGVLPSLILAGIGLGLTVPTASNTATAGVATSDSGIASALVSVGQQIGGSVGTALLNTVAVSATTAYVAAHGPAAGAAGTVHGYTVAFWWSAGIFVAGAVICGSLLTGKARTIAKNAKPALAE
jgi:EmrB/QacA subfamily drug resistance transporter